VRKELDRLKHPKELGSEAWNLPVASDDPKHPDNRGSASFGYEIISDTIIFYVKDVAESMLSRAYGALLYRCSVLYISLLCEHNLLLRGVVSASREYVADTNLFLAPSLGRSHQLEKIQNWGAIAVDVDQICYQCGPVQPHEELIVPCYFVPLKSTDLGSAYILNVITRPSVQLMRSRSLSLSQTITRMEESAKALHTPREVSDKLKNTAKYLSYCRAFAKSET
jgi:hypothetical protein